MGTSRQSLLQLAQTSVPPEAQDMDTECTHNTMKDSMSVVQNPDGQIARAVMQVLLLWL